MRAGFRVWMTAVGIFVVLLTVAVVLLYSVSVTGERLKSYNLDRATVHAVETADSITRREGRDRPRVLDLAATTDNREALFVDRDGRVVERAGPGLLGEEPGVFREAAAGGRMIEGVGGLDVAVVPVFYGGEARGGVVIASRGATGGAFGLFVRSVIEGALLACVLAGGLALLLASLLGRRVERLASGARAVERGDLSYRIEPGFRDELGGLASSFNAMAEKFQDSFSRLEERVAERTGELEVERARLETVLRQMPSGVVIAEAPSGKVLLSNERAERIRGHALPKHLGDREIEGYKGFGARGRPYAPEEWPLARTIRTGEEIAGEEIEISRGDGTRAMLRVASFPILDRDGRIVAGVAVFKDVTRQRRAEEALRESGARFRAVFEQAAVGMAEDAPDGRMLRVNKKLSEILGYPEEELLGRTFKDFTHSDDLEENKEQVRKLLAGEAEAFSAEKRYVRKDGSVIWGNVSASLVRKPSGELASMVAVVEDVTERKRAEEELRCLNEDLERRVRERTAELERERRTLDAVLDNLSEGVMAVEAGGRVVFANPASRSLLGGDGAWPPGGVPNPWADFDLPLAVARSSKEGESIIARVGGERCTTLMIHLEPLPGLGGGRSGALVVMRDFSETRRLEAEQQRFLANAAHELKTPLTAILGAAELLREDDEDPRVRRRFLRRIHEEAERMNRLSETMLKLARTGTDLREPNLQPVDLCTVAHRASESMETMARRAGLAIRVQGPGGRVRADEEWLEEALLILLTNAIKHSNWGGCVRVRATGNTVAVEDEGDGIPKENLPHVFERFYRGRGNTGGFGLGLPICKELVERMDGGIHIESEEGTGTSIKVSLPRPDREQHAPSPRA